MFSEPYFLFSASLWLFFGIGLIELLGVIFMGSGLIDSIDLDLDGSDFLAAVTNWLMIKDLPLSVVLLLISASFGLLGFGIQEIAFSIMGTTLIAPAAASISLGVSLVAVRAASRVLSPLFASKTTSVSEKSLIGREATITCPISKVGNPGGATIVDANGHPHHIMIEPETDEDEFLVGEKVWACGRRGYLFIARR